MAAAVHASVVTGDCQSNQCAGLVASVHVSVVHQSAHKTDVIIIEQEVKEDDLPILRVKWRLSIIASKRRAHNKVTAP